MRKITIIPIAFCLFFGSCKYKTNDNKLLSISIDVNAKKEIVKLSGIASGIKYVKLETKPDFLVGRIDKYIISDKIYIMQNTKINVFDLNGMALYEIDHLNQKGPAGYREINEIRVDTTTHLIEAWDRNQRKMIKYNSEDGKFIDYKHIKIFAFSFLKLAPDSYLFYSNYHPNVRYSKNNLYQIFFLDKDGELINRFIEEPENKRLSGKPLDIFCFFDGKLLISPTGNNSVYSLKDNKCIEVLRLNFGKYQLVDDYFKSKKYWGWEVIDGTEYAVHMGGVQENKWCYRFDYKYNRKIYRVLYSKLKGKVTVIDNILNDFDGNFKINFHIQNKLYVAPISSFYLKRCYQEIQNNMDKNGWDKFRSKHVEFSRICENSTDNDNPILLIITPKKF